MIPIRVVDDSLRFAQTLAEAMTAAERALGDLGWRYLGGEVETANGDIAFVAGLWCATCGPAFEQYLDRRPT